MKLILSTLLCFVTVFYSLGQDAKEVSSKIEEVTVFLNGAQVHRTSAIEVKPGENVIKLTGLTQYIDPNSIQVEGNPKYDIMSVKHQVNYLQDQSLSPEIREKKDSLDDLQFSLEMRRSLRNVYTEEKGMILANKSIKGNDGTLLAEDLLEVSDFFRERLKEIEYKLLELNREEADIQKDIQRINNYLNSLNAKRNRQTSDILVTLQATGTSRASLELSYMVQQAGWFPIYDIRAEDTDNPVNLIYKAKVWQSTGNDWDNTLLTLSTGNPSIRGEAPNLNPWYLRLIETYDKRSNSRARDAYAPATEEAMVLSYDDAGGSSADYTTTVQNTLMTEFKISIPYDIPSDNQRYEVEMKRVTLAAEYTYLTIPKLDNDAFLRADVTDWMEHNLLPGESNIFFKGTFVGKSFIDPAITEDTLHLSLGRDQSVVVKREQIKDYCKTTSLGLKKKTSKGYEITVQNTKSQSIDIRLKDQIPISTSGDIEVEIIDMSGAKHDATTGELLWDLTLKPGESRSVVIKFSVKYPKKKVISNL
jgi:uncharacterized protein (TIGR02231 family)